MSSGGEKRYSEVGGVSLYGTSYTSMDTELDRAVVIDGDRQEMREMKGMYHWAPSWIIGEGGGAAVGAEGIVRSAVTGKGRRIRSAP